MIQLALNTMLFLYVFGVFIFSKVEGLSLATNVALLGLLLILGTKGLKSGLVGLKSSLIILPLVFILFLSIFWSRYQVEASISFLSFLTASVGGIAVMLALMNGANPKVVFWSTFLGSSYLVYSAWQERTTLMLSRVAGIVGNANDLAITLIVAGILLFASPVNASRWSKAYALFLLIFTVYMTGSRKTLLAVGLIALFLLVGVAHRGLTKNSLKKTILLIGVTATFLSFAGPFVWTTFTQTATYKRAIEGVGGPESSTNIRSAMIVDGLNLWKEKPLLGYGVNQYRYKSVYNTYSHNNYIELLASGGLIVFVTYYGILFLLLVKARRIRGQAKALVVFSIMLLLVWDITMVSYASKINWLLISFCAWLSLRESSLNVVARSTRTYPSGKNTLLYI